MNKFLVPPIFHSIYQYIEEMIEIQKEIKNWNNYINSNYPLISTNFIIFNTNYSELQQHVKKTLSRIRGYNLALVHHNIKPEMKYPDKLNALLDITWYK